MSAYYINVGGKTYGPATSDELEKWHKAGTFQPTDFVWDAASGAWVEAVRFDATRSIFRDVSAPASGLLSIDELSDSERGRFVESSGRALDRCEHHSEIPAVGVCPHCKRAFCAECLRRIDGTGVCLDCIGNEKKRGAGNLRLYLPIIAFVLIGTLVFVLGFLYAAGRPPEQPGTLERIEIPRVAPRETPVIESTSEAETSETPALEQEE